MNLMDTLKPSTIVPKTGRIVGKMESEEKLKKAERKRVERIKSEIAKAQRVVSKYENRMAALHGAISAAEEKFRQAKLMCYQAKESVREWEAKL